MDNLYKKNPIEAGVITVAVLAGCFGVYKYFSTSDTSDKSDKRKTYTNPWGDRVQEDKEGENSYIYSNGGRGSKKSGRKKKKSVTKKRR
jgi:hypothetical protein